MATWPWRCSASRASKSDPSYPPFTAALTPPPAPPPTPAPWPQPAAPHPTSSQRYILRRERDGRATCRPACWVAAVLHSNVICFSGTPARRCVHVGTWGEAAPGSRISYTCPSRMSPARHMGGHTFIRLVGGGRRCHASCTPAWWCKDATTAPLELHVAPEFCSPHSTHPLTACLHACMPTRCLTCASGRPAAPCSRLPSYPTPVTAYLSGGPSPTHACPSQEQVGVCLAMSVNRLGDSGRGGNTS